ncbi:MAG TPA: hypothetical protein VND22_05160 [Actinomycetota bacterium]|nr:hypothetical protein [Actinomycetota bacterium]
MDTVDDNMMHALKDAWQESQVGCSNVYSLVEVQNMSREALEMGTINAKVLWGTNPFPAPTRNDFADDLARASETVLRDARSIMLYGWLTDEERQASVEALIGKYGLRWALRNLIAFRTGDFPRTFADVRAGLEGTPEGDFLLWLDDNPEESDEVAQKINELAIAWFVEIAEFRKNN